MQVESIEVELESTNGKIGTGSARGGTWSPAEQRKRAWKTLGILWGCSLVSVILPLAHFVLVPGFFLAGPVAALVILSQQSQIQGSECACPSCGKPLPLAKMAPKWPLSSVCSNCHEGIRITAR